MKLPKNKLKEAIQEAKLIFVEGENGTGKTVYSINRAFKDYGKYPLILSLDNKADRTKAAAINIKSYEDFNKYIGELLKPEWKQEYKTIVFDVLSELDKVVREEAIRRWNTNEGGQINPSMTQIEELDFGFTYGVQKKPWIAVWEQVLGKIKMLTQHYQVIVTDYTVLLEVINDPIKDEKGKVIEIRKNNVKGPAVAAAPYIKEKKPFVIQTLKALADEHIRCEIMPGLIDPYSFEFRQIKVMARDENAVIDWESPKADDPIIITEEKKTKKPTTKKAETKPNVVETKPEEEKKEEVTQNPFELEDETFEF
jgi:hypothetical protein